MELVLPHLDRDGGYKVHNPPHLAYCKVSITFSPSCSLWLLIEIGKHNIAYHKQRDYLSWIILYKAVDKLRTSLPGVSSLLLKGTGAHWGTGASNVPPHQISEQAIK